MQEIQNDCRYVIGTNVEKFGRKFSVTKEVERRSGRLFVRIRQQKIPERC